MQKYIILFCWLLFSLVSQNLYAQKSTINLTHNIGHGNYTVHSNELNYAYFFSQTKDLRLFVGLGHKYTTHSSHYNIHKPNYNIYDFYSYSEASINTGLGKSILNFKRYRLELQTHLIWSQITYADVTTFSTDIFNDNTITLYDVKLKSVANVAQKFILNQEIKLTKRFWLTLNAGFESAKRRAWSDIIYFGGLGVSYEI